MDISGTNLQEIAIIIPVVDGNGTIDDAATLRTVSFDGEKFIAGDNNGNIYVSADGASWSGEGSTGTRPLSQPLTYDGTYYYAVTAAGIFNPTPYPGYTDLGNARYSTDLSTWTAINNGNSNIAANNFVTVSWNGGQGNTPYQATGIQSGFSMLRTQINTLAGANAWQGVTTDIFAGDPTGGPRKNIYGAGRWVVLCDDVGGAGGSDVTFRTKIISLANANVITSSDIVFSGNTREYYSSMAYGNGIFMATPQGYSSVAANVILTSTDGVTWTRANVSWPNSIGLSTSLTYSNNSSTWAMLTRPLSQTACDGIWISNNNGNTWSNIAPAEGGLTWWSLAYGDGKFVAVGANGAYFTASGY
jgi:hypothetical protein